MEKKEYMAWNWENECIFFAFTMIKRAYRDAIIIPFSASMCDFIGLFSGTLFWTSQDYTIVQKIENIL